uniref:Uncharacterized protein n=1 Tax=Arundo donax TaxID=35708 RepID=A0A0A8Z117_ARUDO
MPKTLLCFASCLVASPLIATYPPVGSSGLGSRVHGTTISGIDKKE